MALALRRQRDVEQRLDAQQRIEDDLRASEAKFSGILSIAADARRDSVDPSEEFDIAPVVGFAAIDVGLIVDGRDKGGSARVPSNRPIGQAVENRRPR